MMPITGILYDRIGPKIMAIFGLLVLGATTYLFHNIDVTTPTSLIAVWIGMRYFGMAFAQMPASSASIEAVPVELSSRASAISNIITRVSASFGIALLTSILNSRETSYTAQIQDHITGADIPIKNFLGSLSMHLNGYSAAESRAIGIGYLKGMIDTSAFVRALDDLFVIATCITLVSLIPAFFLKRDRIDVPKK
jgi:MFS family permease